MKKLTKEQAIVISGYTGVINDPEALAKDASKRLGRELSVADLPIIRAELQNEYFNDFLNLLPTTDNQQDTLNTNGEKNERN